MIASQPLLDEEPVLAVRGLRKRLGGRFVLEGLDLVVERGETVAVFGENGAGKSTLLRAIAGVLAIDAGAVSLAGEALDAGALALRHLGYVPEGIEPMPHLTVAEYVELVCALRQVAPPDERAVLRLGVGPLLGRRLGTLSLGQRRRGLLLAALCGTPKLLVLDEPTNGLDAESAAVLTALVREQAEAGRATLLATHDRPFADRVSARRLLLDGGRLLPAS